MKLPPLNLFNRKGKSRFQGPPIAPLTIKSPRIKAIIDGTTADNGIFLDVDLHSLVLMLVIAKEFKQPDIAAGRIKVFLDEQEVERPEVLEKN